jgi:hypothetical protein
MLRESVLVRSVRAKNQPLVLRLLKTSKLPMNCATLLVAAVTSTPDIFQAVLTGVCDQKRRSGSIALREALLAGACAALIARKPSVFNTVMEAAAAAKVVFDEYAWWAISLPATEGGAKDTVAAVLGALQSHGPGTDHALLSRIVAQMLETCCRCLHLRALKQVLVFAAARRLRLGLVHVYAFAIAKKFVGAIRQLAAYKYADEDELARTGACPISGWGDTRWETGCTNHPMERVFSQPPLVLEAMLRVPWAAQWMRRSAKWCLQRAVCCSWTKTDTLRALLRCDVVADWTPHAAPAIRLACRLGRLDALVELVTFFDMGLVAVTDPLIVKTTREYVQYYVSDAAERAKLEAVLYGL